MANFFYNATKSDFVETIENSIDYFIDEMKKGAKSCGVTVGEREIISWKENAKVLSPLLSKSNIPDDVVIAFEYQIPTEIGGGRIDCMLFGEDKFGKKNIVHIELKQWSNKNVEICYDGYLFKTKVEVDGYKGDSKHSAHPSAQAEEYQIHLENYIEVLAHKDINLVGIAYCYNYDSRKEPNVLYSKSYSKILERCPLYGRDQENALIAKLEDSFEKGEGNSLFQLFLNSEVKPTKRLQDAAKTMFDGDKAKKEFALIGEQLVAYNEILGAINETDKENEKTVVIVKGGPGTGKSVIAFQLIAGLAKTGQFKNVLYSTRSKSLKNGYQEILKDIYYKEGENCRAIDLIKKNINIKPKIYGENGIDALIVDEAHRIEKSSNKDEDRDKSLQTHLPQILSMIFCSRVSIFFIDDFQSVKSVEIGTSEMIKENALNYYDFIEKENRLYLNGPKKGYWRTPFCDLSKKIQDTESHLQKIRMIGDEKKIRKEENKLESLKRELEFGEDWVKTATPKIKKVNVIEIELKDQFRCNGSNNYLDWIERVLYKTDRTKDVSFDSSQYEFDVFDKPQDLYAKIRSLDDFASFTDKRILEMGDSFSYKEINKEAEDMKFNQTARLVAGWCWEWKQKSTEQNGDLKHEIIIPEHDFSMPWETVGVKAKGLYEDKYAPNEDVWIIDKRGVNQVGCNHSAQGWESDYIGVIIANDLKYDPITDSLYGDESVRNYDKNVKQQQPDFTRVTKNIYRVLLTRGKKGCFIFACDPGVRDYFKRCMKS